ncbi:hypothetical protein [Rhizorhabdus sp. FW153]|uniref:hypothetical protein n=1 Tax=Rhizorhabdus sp. FW153 TaxID=3400216 RepID=UPI003CF791A4
MSAAQDEPASLWRTVGGNTMRGGRRAPQKIAEGSLREMMGLVAQEDPEEIWRLIVQTGDGRHLRSSDLRDLLRQSAGSSES